MAGDPSKLGAKTGILMPRWIPGGVVLALLGLGLVFYKTVMTDLVPPHAIGGLPVWTIMLPCLALGFGLPRYGKRVGVTLYAHGLSVWSKGERHAIDVKEIETFRWGDSQSVVVLRSGAEVPLPSWLTSRAAARRELEHFATREPTTE